VVYRIDELRREYLAKQMSKAFFFQKLHKRAAHTA
jgi:hypothetical protein